MLGVNLMLIINIFLNLTDYNKNSKNVSHANDHAYGIKKYRLLIDNRTLPAVEISGPNGRRKPQHPGSESPSN